MQRVKKFLFLAFVTFFMSLSVASAGTFSFFSLNWNYTALGPGTISQHALDSIGQVVYFGSGNTFGPHNYLYAVNIANGQEIWNYNTSLPVNYVSHFEYDNSEHIIAGTGGSSSIPSQSYVLAFSSSLNNGTLWISPNLNSTVECVGSAESNLTGTEDVVAGLKNGTIIRLSGNNGIIQWRYNGIVNVRYTDIVQLNDGSVLVGTSDLVSPPEGHIYCLDKNGTLKWSYNSAAGNPLTLVRKFGDVNNDGVPDVVAVFHDDYIYVLDGATGIGMSAPWTPFNVGEIVTDLLCTQDYTGDDFPDIVVGTLRGGLMIIDGRTATPVLPLTSVGYVVSYIQYMNFSKNGVWSSNKTLAVSIQQNSSFTSQFIYGINASDLTPMKQFPVPGGVTAQNLFYVGNYTSPYTGDLLFTASNVVYSLSGTDIIFSEFASNFILISLMISIWFLILILRKRS
jgi:hypothetical protein